MFTRFNKNVLDLLVTGYDEYLTAAFSVLIPYLIWTDTSSGVFAVVEIKTEWLILRSLGYWTESQDKTIHSSGCPVGSTM
jgi:hypothetical protein